MIKTDKIAVVILNWNGRDMMRRFLPSVTEHSADEGLVIVADNGSTDGSLDMLSREFPSVVQLPLPKNYGFAEGYNRALAQIEAPYYLLLNSDVEVSPHWLRPLLDFMEPSPPSRSLPAQAPGTNRQRDVRICRSRRWLHRPLRLPLLPRPRIRNSRSRSGTI